MWVQILKSQRRLEQRTSFREVARRFLLLIKDLNLNSFDKLGTKMDDRSTSTDLFLITRDASNFLFFLILLQFFSKQKHHSLEKIFSRLE